MRRKTKLIVIVGPTASGKSELAVKLAKKLGGEIISADSRQVYHGLNIGTGKVGGKWYNPSTTESLRSYGNCSKFVYKNIPHYCIDFVSPGKAFTAAEYKKCAEAAIKDIASRGKLPILAGGTAFWIDAVVYNLNLPPVPPDPKLRRRLAKKSPKELLALLKKLDKERAQNIESQNPRRLIRAIEIARTLGEVPELKKSSPYHTLWIGLNPPRQTLERKIKNRAKKMLTRGLTAETEKLFRKKISKKRIREFGFEYAAALDYIEGGLTRQKLEERLITDTLRYAKKQLAWWKRNPQIRWFSNSKDAFSQIKARM